MSNDLRLIEDRVKEREFESIGVCAFKSELCVIGKDDLGIQVTVFGKSTDYEFIYRINNSNLIITTGRLEDFYDWSSFQSNHIDMKNAVRRHNTGRA